MGIDPISLALIVGTVASVGAAGASAHQAHAADVHAGQAKRDQVTAQNKLQSQAVDTNNKNQLAQADVAARQRQRALAASYGGPGPGVATSPLGDVGQAQTRQSALLGG